MESTAEAKIIAANDFPCPGCGSQMEFDPDTQTLQCIHCGGHGEIPTRVAEAPEYLYNPQTDSYTAPNWESAGHHVVRCQGCGAETVVPAAVMTAQCPFCGCNYVVDANAVDMGILPETMMPFRLSKKTAIEKFRHWVKKRFWAPGKFKKSSLKPEAMTGIYLPFWTYDADVVTHYTGQGGRDRRETRTRRVNGKTETYTVTVTDWYPISGNDQLAFDDAAVCATKQVNLSLLQKLGAFSMKTLAWYNPAFLAGFQAKRYDVGVGEGFASARSGMEDSMESHIRSSLGYDHYRYMQYQHQFYNVKFKHILLPVWMSSYKYKEKIYQFMINGETGKVAGKSPVSPLKVLGAVLLCAAIVAAVFLLANYL